MDQVASNTVASFKDPYSHAPGNLVFRLARLAFSCAAMPGASLPAMSQLLVDMVKMREAVFGSQANKVASRIDDES
ncbi:hypothetical protein CLOM_g13734 [Closterium sp. NIES-68]|nr:hypothetical protein CLOM_g13734 [Closterium sp. NIES-68]